MILIIGGESQGKLTTALKLTGLSKSQAAPGGKLTPEEAAQYPIINQLHLLVRSILENGGQPSELRKTLQGKTVICNEIGCGIVPVDALERQWREETGRLCCALAQDADLVVRVHCGIAQALKGELVW